MTAIELDGRARRVRAPEAGMAFAGDETDANASLRAEAKPDLETAAKAFGGRVAGIDPAGRRIALLDGAAGGCEWFELWSPE